MHIRFAMTQGHLPESMWALNAFQYRSANAFALTEKRLGSLVKAVIADAIADSIVNTIVDIAFDAVCDHLVNKFVEQAAQQQPQQQLQQQQLQQLQQLQQTIPPSETGSEGGDQTDVNEDTLTVNKDENGQQVNATILIAVIATTIHFRVDL